MEPLLPFVCLQHGINVERLAHLVDERAPELMELLLLQYMFGRQVF